MRSGRPVRSPGAHPRRRYRRMSIEQMYYFSYAVPMESLRSTPYAAWFDRGITLGQVQAAFAAACRRIRIASGFFTVRGWGLIRQATAGKEGAILVGIEDPGAERARPALGPELR